MRFSAPVTLSALIVAGVVCSGSSVHVPNSDTSVDPAEALLATSAAGNEGSGGVEGDGDTALSRMVGLLPAVPEPSRGWREVKSSADVDPIVTEAVSVRSVPLPIGRGALGIPEIVLAAYRNAELTLESTQPSCGVTWNLLAAIGRIESAHASAGRTDAAGTTTTPIFGPALDGTLPGNEVIVAGDGSAVRALGPMQFLPGTWSRYAADGNGDGVSDPHNVFDATSAAAKYLCSGGLDLRDPAQELRAVLRYNNSRSYAADVLSWSTAYRTGGTASQAHIVESVPSMPTPGPGNEDVVAANNNTPTAPAEVPSETLEMAAEAPAEVPDTQQPAPGMITIPGLPPIPCGIFCPPVVQEPGPGQEAAPDPSAVPVPDAPIESTAPTPPPAITLPFGIVVPIPRS